VVVNNQERIASASCQQQTNYVTVCIVLFSKKRGRSGTFDTILVLIEARGFTYRQGGINYFRIPSSLD
jgi:hypothetical protein